MSFELIDDWEYPPEPVRGGRWANTNAVPFNCPGCGRFAKMTEYRKFYDGTFNRETLYFHCSKCGDGDLEMV